MRIFLFLLFICPSVFAGYTTMTIDAVQQANGVWTAAGVMDNMGFVRTTGAVSVMGTTRNLPVAFAADQAASGLLLKSAARLAGPVALAATAYDVYQWIESDPDIGVYNNDWIVTDGDIESFGNYWEAKDSAKSGIASSPLAAAQAFFAAKNQPTVIYGTPSCTFQTSTNYICSAPNILNPAAGSYPVNAFRKPCSGQNTASCKDAVYADSDWFNNKLDQPSIPLIISGWTNIPSLIGSPTPIKGGLSFTPFSEWSGEPYFKDGQWYRDRMDISPCPTASQPTRVCVDIGPQKFEGATDPQTIPSQATGTATGSTPKEQTDFCKKNPQSIACAELGELEPEPFDPIEKPFQVVAQSPWGSGDASCPAPKVINLHAGGTVTMSYQPACDFFSGVRPAVLALAWLVALYIALGIPVGKGD